MPADIVGTNIVQEHAHQGGTFFEFQPGPIFANVVLADEINRATPKTQSALLEAMQEHSVSVGKTTYKLEQPFLVLATQNPLEMEGTYPLPEAQLDRFFFKLKVLYPLEAAMHQILEAHHPHDGHRGGARDGRRGNPRDAPHGAVGADRKARAGVRHPLDDGVAPGVAVCIAAGQALRALRRQSARGAGTGPGRQDPRAHARQRVRIGG
jgi:MoxR-like ATPase